MSELINRMEITRGDTQLIKFQRKDRQGQVIEDTPIAMYFSVKYNSEEQELLIQKKLTNFTKDEDNFWHFRIESADTEDLPYGTYVYDIEVITEDYTKTIVKGDFVLTEEVTHKQNED